jgi:hypothetical protein
MADIRITPGSSIMAFTSSLNFKETLTQDASGSLVLQGSGSLNRTNIFAIDGNNGRLFSVDDDLSDSLFSVNTIAGLPVIEAFANNTVVLGQYGANVLVVTGSNIGMGIANPSYKLHVSGTIYATGDVVSYSDKSVKTNIRPIENILKRITNSRGVLYDRIDNNEKNNIGFIAQELEEQFPELVVTNEDGTKAVKYQNSVAILFEAIKEQQNQIEELTKLVNQLTK